MLKQPEEVFLLADSDRVYDGDYFFGTENGILRRYGKEADVRGTGLRIYGPRRFCGAICSRILKNALNELIDAQCHGKWWEDAIYSLSREMEIPVKDIRGRFWAEVDFIEDYRRILDHISEKTGKRINGSIITPHNRVSRARDREKKNIVWNMIGSFLYALSSMVLSIAVCTDRRRGRGGNLHLCVFHLWPAYVYGRPYFGIRPFQITDMERRYSFGDYLGLRRVTCLAAVLAAAVTWGSMTIPLKRARSFS